MNTPSALYTESVLEETRKYTKKAVEAWVTLKDGNDNQPPKVHILADHLIDVMQHYKGIGDYDESFVESNHQYGMALKV